MKQVCRSCHAEISHAPAQPSQHITSGICRACALEAARSREALEAIDGAVLLMQSNPRQVITANKQALELFGKELHQVEGHRGGEVFDCIHSFTEAGCGKDVNCENCKIKNAIVDTFVTGNPFDGVSTSLEIKSSDGTNTYGMQVTTEKIGEFALVRIDQYNKT